MIQHPLVRYQHHPIPRPTQLQLPIFHQPPTQPSTLLTAEPPTTILRTTIIIHGATPVGPIRRTPIGAITRPTGKAALETDIAKAILAPVPPPTTLIDLNGDHYDVEEHGNFVWFLKMEPY